MLLIVKLCVFVDITGAKNAVVPSPRTAMVAHASIAVRGVTIERDNVGAEEQISMFNRISASFI